MAYVQKIINCENVIYVSRLEQTIKRTKQDKKILGSGNKMNVTSINTVAPWECLTVIQRGPFF